MTRVLPFNQKGANHPCHPIMEEMTNSRRYMKMLKEGVKDRIRCIVQLLMGNVPSNLIPKTRSTTIRR